MTIRLYRHPISGHSHRVELFLTLLALPFELIDVDLLKGAHKQPSFLAKNAFGQVPVLEDSEVTLADSSAILVYLALRYDTKRRFYPSDPVRAAQIQRWLSAASGPLFIGPGRLRVSALLGVPIDRVGAEKTAEQLFSVMEGELAGRAYLVADALTLADLAMYSYTARAPEAGFSLAPYPNIQAWIARLEALPGFLAMPYVRAAG